MKQTCKLIFIALILLGLCVSGVQANAFSAWSAYGDSWKATNDTYTIVMWNQTGTHTWLATGNASSVDYLVVGGGGAGGGQYYGGGGGAGIYNAGTGFSVSGNISINTGAGGLGVVGNVGGSGAQSSFSSIISNGGTGGKTYVVAPHDGSGGAVGSGGEGGYTNLGGGGGGAGITNAGSSASGANGGNGGAGTYNSITGVSTPYAGGGGGNGYLGTGNRGLGGVGGGGNGASYVQGYNTPTDGANGTGGGGGGVDGNFVPTIGANGGSGVVIIRYITPITIPIVSFSATPTTGVNPMTVEFNDTTTSGTPITSWNTSFGDGSWLNQTTFPATNITHLYSTSGNYTVDWYVSNAEGTGTASTTITVWGAVHSAFSLFNAAGTAPHTTYLYDQSTNLTPGPVTYLTDFGDGNTSTEATTYFTWNATGIYNVTHTVSNGLSSETSFTTVTVGTPTPPVVAPVASFYGSPTTGNVPLTVSFTDVSSNTPTSWNWSFGDGIYSELQNPTHSYTRSGFRTVNLTATNSAGSNITVRLKFVRVS